MTKRLRWPILIATCLLLASSAVLGFDFSELEDAVHETTLDNGLRVIVMERHDAPVASFITWCNVGGVDDPKEYTGLAHMFEHMAFKGTMTLGTTDIDAELKAMAVEDSIFAELRVERKKGLRADSARLVELEIAFDAAIEDANQYVINNAFDQTLEAEGAVQINAGTGKDMTMYQMSLPSNKAELWMAMESERFLSPVLREMYRERNVIAEERRQTLENNPIMRTIDAMASAAFKAHPYGISTIGHMSDIQNYNRAAARAYYEKYYVPSNMIVCVVGDVKAKQIFKWAKKYFGRLEAKAKPEPVATVEPEQKGERRVMLEDPAQPLFVCGWHIPNEIHPDWPAVAALADYLGQGRTSLLYKNLAKEKKIATNVGCFPGWPGNKYPCLLLVYAMPSPGAANEEVEEQVYVEVERMKNELIPQDEVEKIKARAKAEFINGMGNNLGLAMVLAAYESSWGDWREMFSELDRINAITPEDIQRVAQTYLTVQNRTVAFLNTTEE
jgi:predicted Zn-dependent peptidase